MKLYRKLQFTEEVGIVNAVLERKPHLWQVSRLGELVKKIVSLCVISRRSL